MKFSCRTVTTEKTQVFLGRQALGETARLIRSLSPRGIFLLADRNTRRLCLPLLAEAWPGINKVRILEIGGGEGDKNPGRAAALWEELMNAGAERSSLLLNLGGGVVSDLGGFVAAGFKRGIRYVNIPTSLVGMADAALGGKTGVNIGNVKNQAGFFHAPSAVLIWPQFLQTLAREHLRSGLAEIIKTALAGDVRLYRRIRKKDIDAWLDLPSDSVEWQSLIAAAGRVKIRTVEQDYRERKQREALNLGHTVGHAMEGLSLTGGREAMFHGDAVAAGMICAAWLSNARTGLAPGDLEDIAGYLSDGFPAFPFRDGDTEDLTDRMMKDKKVSGGTIRFTLLRSPGRTRLRVPCSRNEIADALRYYARVTRADVPSGNAGNHANHEIDHHQ